jgi:hypothetical protein
VAAVVVVAVLPPTVAQIGITVAVAAVVVLLMVQVVQVVYAQTLETHRIVTRILRMVQQVVLQQVALLTAMVEMVVI